jgi:cyanuric acid amidohydrolase
VTHCSSGHERKNNAIILLGNSTQSVSNAVVGHGVLKDGLDAPGVKTILKSMGFQFECCPSARDLERIEYAFLKPKTGEVDTIRGYRHTLRTDPLLGPFAWNVEKGPVHGAVGGVLGTPLMEVATGPEHQGPPGSPLLSIVARVAD